jgi:hypothetical protein
MKRKGREAARNALIPARKFQILKACITKFKRRVPSRWISHPSNGQISIKSQTVGLASFHVFKTQNPEESKRSLRGKEINRIRERERETVVFGVDEAATT